MATLLLAKYHFFCCTTIAILAMIIGAAIRSKISFGKMLAIMATLFIPSIIAGMVQLWVSWHCKLPTIDAIHWHWFATNTEFKKVLKLGGKQTLSHIWHALTDLYQTVYQVNGIAFQSFWGYFGWLDTPLVIVSAKITTILQACIEFSTKMILVLTLVTLTKIIISLLQLLIKGKWRLAFYIASSNPVINSYFLFTLFITLFSVSVYPSFGWQGRHWFPFILSIFLTAASFAPRAFSSTVIRKQAFLLVTGGLLIYSLLANYCAFGCIHKRYFVRENQPAIDIRQLKLSSAYALCAVDCVDYIDFYPTFYRHRNSLAVPAAAPIYISGWAVDRLAHSPAYAVLFYIDNVLITQTSCNLQSPAAADKLHDSAYNSSGFRTQVPSKGLAPGPHCLNIKVISADKHVLYPTEKEIKFVISKSAL